MILVSLENVKKYSHMWLHCGTLRVPFWHPPFEKISNNIDFSLWGKQCVCPVKMRPKSWKSNIVHIIHLVQWKRGSEDKKFPLDDDHCALLTTYMTCHLFASFESILYPCEWHDIHSELAMATWELDKILCQKVKYFVIEFSDWIEFLGSYFLYIQQQLFYV